MTRPGAATAAAAETTSAPDMADTVRRIVRSFANLRFIFYKPALLNLLFRVSV
jgi:hypothetical protein